MSRLENLPDFSNSTIAKFPVVSYDDYCKFIKFAIEKLSNESALSFCLWILDRFRIDYNDEAIFDGFTLMETAKIEEVFAKLKSIAGTKSESLADFATESLARFNNFGSAEEDDEGDISMESLQFFEALNYTLEFCRERNPDYVCGVSEAMVNCVDYYTATTGYSNKNMFTFPDMEKEINLQKQFINRLLAQQNEEL